MTTLLERLAKLPTPEQAANAISALGATGTAVIGFWAHQLSAFAPPDHDSMEFFKGVCAIVGLALGASLYFWRKHASFKPKNLFVASGVCLALGLAAAFHFEAQRRDRLEIVDLANGPRVLVVSNIITQDGRFFLDANPLNECAGENGLTISWGCAGALAHRTEAYDLSFSATDRGASLHELTGWYRLAGALLMLSIYFLVNQFLFEQTRRRAARKP